MTTAQQPVSFVETGTILDRILRRTAADVAARKAATSLAELERMAADRPEPVSLATALSGPELAVIAEFKRASPSKGRFPFDAAPSEVAAQYFTGGAAAMSVLTDEPFFQGSLADMTEAARVAHALPSSRPVLRKDFVLDPFQILEARAHGADAVLLIVAALEQTALESLLRVTHEYGLEALVEIHDEKELARATAVGARIIGINNRDLRTFMVDLAVTERLAPAAPEDALVVGESGIFTVNDAARSQSAGADAVLVGESLVLAPDRAAAVRALIPEQPRT
jgi:indole-3-glycerol phosphate synthase